MKDLIYLDNGATTYPKPEEVYAFMDSFYRSYGVNPGRSGYDLAIETGNIIKTEKDADPLKIIRKVIDPKIASKSIKCHIFLDTLLAI